MTDRLTLPIGWEARIDRGPRPVPKQDRIQLSPPLVVEQHDEPDAGGDGAAHTLTVRGNRLGTRRAIGQKAKHQRAGVVHDDHRWSLADHRLTGRRVPPPNLDDLVRNGRTTASKHPAQLVRYTRAHRPNGHMTKVELSEDNVGSSGHARTTVRVDCRFGLIGEAPDTARRIKAGAGQHSPFVSLFAKLETLAVGARQQRRDRRARTG
jgi:hypothetical protein